MKKIAIIIFSILSNLYFSQEDRAWNMPTSPEVAMIKKVGDIPVGHYTGTMNVPISLYTIKEGNFSLPITLQYSASGIKVDEQATWVGLGWNLAPEGMIIQEVRGVRDFSDDFFKTAVTPVGYDAFYQRIAYYAGGTNNFKVVPQNGVAGWNLCLGTGSLSCWAGSNPNADSEFVVNSLIYGSGQPDVYHFNFVGHNGSFFIHPRTKEVIQLDKKEDIKFVVQNNNIQAITSDGTVFNFSDIEVIDYQGTGGNEPKNGQNYKLSEITLPNQRKIKFEYQDARYNNIFYTQNRNIELSTSGSGLGLSSCSGKINYLYENPTFSNYSSNVKILKSIKTSDTTINFNLEDRSDINIDYSYLGGTSTQDNTLKRLASLDIINTKSNTKIRTYKFSYDYFPYDGTFPSNIALIENNKNVFGQRLKLNSVEGYTYDSNGNEVHINDIHSFEYNMAKTLPPKISFSKDFWGYYNGKANVSLVPNLMYFPVPMAVPSNFDGANRHADKDYVDTNILTKVIYPTKGYSKFEYEANTFYNQFIPSQQKILNFSKNYGLYEHGIGGYHAPFSVTDINIANGINVKFKIMFSAGFDGGTSGPQSKKYTYYQMVMANANAKIYHVITATDGSESLQLLQSWELATAFCNPSDFDGQGSCTKEEYIQLPAGKIRFILNIDNNMYDPADIYHSAGIDLNFTINDYSSAAGQISEGHGVRIKSIKNYDNNNVLSEWKEYEYSGGILQNKYDPFKKKTFYCFDCIPQTYCSGTSIMARSELYQVSDDMTYKSYDAVGYNVVTEVIKGEDGNGNIATKGKIKYTYHNLENRTANYFTVIKEEQNGLLTSETIYDANDDILSSKQYSYKNIIPENYFPSIQTYNNFLTNGRDPIGNEISTGVSGEITKYDYYITPLISRSYKLDSINNKKYFGDKILLSTDKFTYTDKGEVSKKITITPENNIINTSYNYAHEKGNQKLIDANMIGIPLETTTTQTIGSSTKTLSKTETVYPTSVPTIQAGNLLLPLSVKSYDLQNSATTYTEVTYDQYDSRGNLQQYTTKDGVPVAIVWGYNQTQPIAKIEGATYAQINSLASAIISASNTDASASINNDESALLTALNNFRQLPALLNAQVSTYTYDPLIGVRSITPPSGIREYYIYDSANRLEKVVDSNGNILKEYKYNYKQ